MAFLQNAGPFAAGVHRHVAIENAGPTHTEIEPFIGTLRL